MNIYDFAIIGGGPTGYSAAMYAGRLNLKTVIFSKSPGGLIITTERVENYPGFKSISGYEIFKRIREHALEYNIEEQNLEVLDIVKDNSSFIIKTNKEEFKSRTILFATGAEYRKLNAPGSLKFENKGVHYCALCDGFAYKDKVVAVVGGSDSAAKEAIELAKLTSKVYIIYRNEFKPEPVTEKRIKEIKKVILVPKNIVKEIKGKDKVEAVVLKNPYNGETELKVDGVFVAIGHIPKSDLAEKLGVKLNNKKQIVTTRYMETNIPGVYAAGDVSDTEFKQMIVGCAEAVIAAYKAFNFLEH